MTDRTGVDSQLKLPDGGVLVCVHGLTPVEFDLVAACMDANLPAAKTAALDSIQTSVYFKSFEHVIIFVRSSVKSLALALEALDDYESAIATWLSEKKSLLQIVRGDRRRITLLDAELLVMPAASCWDVLNKKSGVDFSLLVPAHSDSLRQPGSASICVAGTLIGLDRRVTEISQELDAALVGPMQFEGICETAVSLLRGWSCIAAKVSSIKSIFEREACETESHKQEDGTSHSELGEDFVNWTPPVQKSQSSQSRYLASQFEVEYLDFELNELESCIRASFADSQARSATYKSSPLAVQNQAGVPDAPNLNLVRHMASDQTTLTIASEQIVALERKLTDSENELSSLKDEIAVARQESITLSERVDTRDAEISALRTALTLQCDLSAKLTQERTQFQQSMRDLRLQLGDHLLVRAKNASLRKRIETLEQSWHRERSFLGSQLLEDADTARILAKSLDSSLQEHRNLRALLGLQMLTDARMLADCFALQRHSSTGDEDGVAILESAESGGLDSQVAP